ncbi:MAG: hypothetical protein FWE90_06150 [Defluviitaleaceae bacterium]|nr:hypothetical protein [Defluviitaleaceae bacterium]
MKQIKNRKVRNKEIERQRKVRNRLVAVIAFLTVAVAIAAVSWVVWDTQSRGWILRFEGQRIPVNEMRVFMQSDTPEAKQDALDILIESLTLIQRAEQHGVGLTEEERAMWAWLVEMQWGEDHLIPSERLGEFIAATSGEIWMRLMDIYVPEFMVAIHEEEFAAELEAYKEANFYNYLKMEVMYILAEEEESAEDARERFLAGETTFEGIVREFNPWYEEDEDVMTMTVHEFIEEAGLNAAQRETLLAMQPGEISEIIPWGEEFGMSYQILVYVVSREEPDGDEIALSFRNDRILRERHAMMMSLVPQWISQANITKNQRAFNLI